MSKGRGKAPSRRKGRVWLAVGAVVLGGAGAAVTIRALGSGPATARAAGSGVIRTPVDSLGLVASPSGGQVLSARSTKAFSMLAVSWEDAHTPLHGTVQVRTKSSATGTWTAWRRLVPNDAQPDPTELDRPGVRGGMAPMWAGPSNGVEVRVVAAHGTRALPTGLTVDLVDPGRSGGEVSQVRAAAAADPAMAPAGYAMDVTASPTDSAAASPTDTTGASASPTDTAAATPTDTAAASPTDTTGATASPTDTTATSAAPTDTATTSSAPPTAPGYLPSLSAAYPSCPASSASPSASAAQSLPSPLPTEAPASTVAPPPIVSRAGWGADECARETGYPGYADAVKVVFVHHTDTTNDYSCTDSPAIVRGLYALHLRQGWRDIGYNFLVDKCGTVFEGRFGGTAMPVIGAQTYGFNTNSLGIAAIGTYIDLSGGDSTASPFTGAAPSPAMQGAIARLAAWKLGMYGINPGTGKSTLTEGATNSYGFTFGTTYTFNAVSGHRNGFATDCPGNQLYAALGAIRSYAAGPVTGLAVTGVAGPYGVVKSGTAYVTGTKATVKWSQTTPATVISGFDVLVDGTVAAHTAGTAVSATVPLTAGSHTVTVRATHIRGGTALSAGAAVIADTTKPTYSAAPSVWLRSGTVNTAAVPVSVGWKVTDNTGLRAQAGTSPVAATLSASATGWSTTAKSGVSDLFAVKATDLAGNTATASVYRTPSIVQETSAVASGSWTTRSGTSYLGGYSRSSGTTGSSLTWTFTGRSVAWIVSRASTSGQAKLYVDGTYLTTVDLKSATTQYRQAIWHKAWSGSAKHTLKVVVVGTSGRPTVTTDGIAVIG